MDHLLHRMMYGQNRGPANENADLSSPGATVVGVVFSLFLLFMFLFPVVCSL